MVGERFLGKDENPRQKEGEVPSWVHSGALPLQKGRRERRPGGGKIHRRGGGGLPLISQQKRGAEVKNNNEKKEKTRGVKSGSESSPGKKKLKR